MLLKGNKHEHPEQNFTGRGPGNFPCAPGAGERRAPCRQRDIGFDYRAPMRRREGEVKKVNKDTGKLTIKHGELKNLGMPPMTMVFRVKDPIHAGPGQGRRQDQLCR